VGIWHLKKKNPEPADSGRTCLDSQGLVLVASVGLI
jgi:hypothetical protein